MANKFIFRTCSFHAKILNIHKCRRRCCCRRRRPIMLPSCWSHPVWWYMHSQINVKWIHMRRSVNIITKKIASIVSTYIDMQSWESCEWKEERGIGLKWVIKLYFSILPFYAFSTKHKTSDVSYSTLVCLSDCLTVWLSDACTLWCHYIRIKRCHVNKHYPKYTFDMVW